jgi:hypothetical protein
MYPVLELPATSTFLPLPTPANEPPDGFDSVEECKSEPAPPVITREPVDCPDLAGHQRVVYRDPETNEPLWSEIEPIASTVESAERNVR